MRPQPDAGELPGTIGETAAAVEGLGRRALALKLDLDNDADIDAVVDRTLGEFGRIDILVNNAVIVGPRRKFLGGDAEFIDLAYRVNVRGPYRLAERVSEIMAARGGGTIVNITSGAARHPQVRWSRRRPPSSTRWIRPTALPKQRWIASPPRYAGELKAHGIAIVSVSPGAGHHRTDSPGGAPSQRRVLAGGVARDHRQRGCDLSVVTACSTPGASSRRAISFPHKSQGGAQ